MRIKTQFMVTMILFGVILAAIAASIIATNVQSSKVGEQENLANDIARGANDLSYLYTDYLIYQEDQLLSRWQSKFASFSSQVKSLHGDNPEQQALVKNIQASTQRLEDIFRDVSSVIAENYSGSLNTAAGTSFFRVSWSRMMIQSQSLASDATGLARLLRSQADALKQTDLIIIFALVGVFAVYILANYLIIRLRTLDSISELQKGSEIIGSGNLDYQIREKKNDEIGDISIAFNRMTARLREVTASKGQLENEINVRRHFEEELYRVNRELRAVSECSQAIVRATDEQELLGRVCRIICEIAGYRMAWVGMMEYDEAKSIRPAAWGGTEDGYLAGVSVTWADTERGRGPTGLAARTGKTHFFQDFTTELAAAPWREAALKRGYRSSIAVPLKDKDGTTFGVFTLYAVRPQGFTPAEVELLEQLAGDLAFGIGALRDRTERGKAGAVLQRSRERFRLLSDVNSLLLTSDKPERIIYMIASRVMEHLDCDAFFNYIVDEASGCLMLNAYAGIPEEKAQDFKLLEAGTGICGCAARDGCTIVLENIQVNGDERAGLVRSVGMQAYACHPLRMGDKTIGTLSFGTRWRASFNDDELDLMKTIADRVSSAIYRRRMEESLRQTGDYLDNLFNYANAPIIVWNPEFEISRFNRAFERLTGRSAVEVIGKKLDFLFPEGSHDASMNHIRDATAGKRWEVVEIPIMHVDGTVRILLWNSAPIFGADGKTIIATIAQGQDITDRKRNEQLKDEFIGLVSHELKTPITVIMGAIDTAMTDGVPREEGFQLLLDAAASAEALAGIVDNLLELSRAQADRLVIKKEQVDIGRVAAGVIEKLAGRSNKHRLMMDVAPDLPDVVADRLRTERILYNLLENAIKYSPKGGSITVSARQEPGWLIVGVKDEGPGIAPDDQAKIFQPFERLDIQHRVGGVGLGLNVCRRLVEAHGGRIWVESQPEKGSTFFFSLPLDGQPARKPSMRKRPKQL